jgi:saccharopepsin
MVERMLLKDDLFALRLREPAELSIGSFDQHIQNITWLPLTKMPLDYSLSDGWKTLANYVAVGDSPEFRFSLDGMMAKFTTTSSFIQLPDLIVSELLYNLGFNFDLPFIPPSVGCNERQYLPNIHFNLAGYNFTLSPYEYTLEWSYNGRERRCVSAILPIGLPSSEVDEIVLGSAFLRGFYSVFDFGHQSIGCKLNHLVE